MPYINDNFQVESFHQNFTEPEGLGAFDGQDEGPKTIVLLAYHKYLLRNSGGEVDVLAQMIYEDALEQSPAAFGLLGHVTKDAITEDTFIEAAELLINSNK
jgi:hypothetical protein